MRNDPRVPAQLIYLMVFFAFAVVGSELFADSEPADVPYKMIVADGKYLFVMFEQISARCCNRDECGFKDIVCVYPSAGLYRNDGTTTPLWTVDFYAYKNLVYISEDGQHLVRMGRWARSHIENKFNQLAVAFYENGKLIKEYLISDLVRDVSRLIYTVSHFEWKKRNSVSFDDTLKQLTLTTVDNQTYIFDIISGEIVKKRVRNRLQRKRETFQKGTERIEFAGIRGD